jgi:hypothetical protein
MKNRRMPRGTAAFVTILAVLSLFLHACGQANDTCNIECEDTGIPGSAVSIEHQDSTCDQCAKQFYKVRLGICGLEKNPTCRCSYLCQTEWEFKY